MSGRARLAFIVAGFLTGISVFRPGPACGQKHLIDFDNFSTGGPGEGGQVHLTQQYEGQGVLFNSPSVLDYSRGKPLSGFAHSGTKGIEQCYAQEFCTTPFEFRFTRAQVRVKVWVGCSDPLKQNRTVVLRAYGKDATPVASSRIVLQSSPVPRSIRVPIEVALEQPRIVRATVGFASPGESTAGLALDDLEFESRPPPPPLVPVPDLLGLTRGDAAARLAGIGLELGDIAKEESGKRSGTVIRQKIAAGSRVQPGTAIAVVLAIPRTVPVPDLVGRTPIEAERLLRSAGLRMSPNPGPPVPSIRVTRQDPAPGTRVPAGSLVSVQMAPLTRPPRPSPWPGRAAVAASITLLAVATVLVFRHRGKTRSGLRGDFRGRPAPPEHPPHAELLDDPKIAVEIRFRTRSSVASPTIVAEGTPIAQEHRKRGPR
jgi:hypothetical protein